MSAWVGIKGPIEARSTIILLALKIIRRFSKRARAYRARSIDQRKAKIMWRKIRKLLATPAPTDHDVWPEGPAGCPPLRDWMRGQASDRCPRELSDHERGDAFIATGVRPPRS